YERSLRRRRRDHGAQPLGRVAQPSGGSGNGKLGRGGIADAQHASAKPRGGETDELAEQSRLNAYISENLALREEIERLKAPVAQPKPWAHGVARLLQSRPLTVIFVCATAAVWAALLLELGPPEVLG